MTHMLIRHKIADYGKWKPHYDERRFARQAAGLKEVHLWRSSDDPGEVVMLFEASDVGKAKEFAGSADLKDKMRSAGVQGAPDILFLS